MACRPKGKCAQAYRKPGKNSVHCYIQTKKGGKWDFCAHQYLCQRTNRWELTAEANYCPMKQERAKKQTKKKSAKKTTDAAD